MFLDALIQLKVIHLQNSNVIKLILFFYKEYHFLLLEFQMIFYHLNFF